MQLKISVVVPTYNRPNLLLNCLRSLQKQSLNPKEFEVLVVSDGPDKKTQKAMKSWIRNSNLNIQFIQSLERKGPASTRNRGWLAAKSPLIAFTDDDCLPDKYWLHTILKNYADEELVVFSGKTIVPLPKNSNPTDFALNLSKLGEAEFITANCACTRASLIKVGGFDERFKMAWREDSDLEFKFISNGIPIKKINSAIVIHPIRFARWGISVFEQKKGIYDALLFKKYPKLYREKIQSDPLWFYYFTLIIFLGLLYSFYIHSASGTLIFGIAYFYCILTFILKRLKGTCTSGSHILEMVSTSIVIPFLSVYYRLYGAIKYKTLFF